MPPAIPNRPEMNEVEMIAQAMRTKSKGVMCGPRPATISHVMAGLVPGHPQLGHMHKDVDARPSGCFTPVFDGLWRGMTHSNAPRQHAVDHAGGVRHAVDRDE